jgi:hypothetical protein
VLRLLKIKTLSKYLSVPHRELRRLGIFDAIIDRDSLLCIDPQLLFSTQMPELGYARQRIDKHFTTVISLIKASKQKRDLPWREALRRLTFKEERGVAIGLSKRKRDGSGIGPVLASRLLETGKELVALGIEDPALFEVLPLFEEGFGADRLSDMAISLLVPDLENLNIRITKELSLKQARIIIRDGQPIKVATYRDGTIIRFLPTDILRPVPLATDFESVDMAAQFNDELRARWNSILHAAWKKKTEVHKNEVRNLFLSKEEFFRALIKAYREHEDITEEETNDAIATGKEFANKNPLPIHKSPISPAELREVIGAIITQFKKCIEANGLWNHLYRNVNGTPKPLHERFSQLLFFSIADSYCTANNLDLSREPNAGSGSVDFKISHGRNARYLLEIKLSSHKALVHGYESQLPLYQESEEIDEAGLLIIRVNHSMSRINQVLDLQRRYRGSDQRAPDVYVIDGRVRETASKS